VGEDGGVRPMVRKRVWDVDCLSMDAALSSTFESREIINYLSEAANYLDLGLPESSLEVQAHLLIHHYCHSENPISLKIETLLNLCHDKVLAGWERKAVEDIQREIFRLNWEEKRDRAGFIWALAVDPRDEVSGMRRVFYLRHQLQSFRNNGKGYWCEVA